MLNSIKIFCDFDGTVCLADVRTLLFRHFGGDEVVHIGNLWFKGKISGVECIQRECEAIVDLDIEIFNRLIDEQIIDPAFPPFVEYCRSNNIEIEILSDGYDYYIRRILDRYNLNDIPVYANTLRFENFKPVPGFPYYNPNCDRTANCKGTHVLINAGDDQLRVVVGDGFSDRCAADYADVVFAKRQLVRYCREANISYTEFSDFNDVRDQIGELLMKKRLIPRHRATIRRKEAFRIEAND